MSEAARPADSRPAPPPAGRRAALLVLGLLLLLRLLDPTPVATLRLTLFDLYQRLQPRAADGGSVVVVDIDDASLTRHGQWPWPRSLVARLVDAVALADARLVGLGILFPERDRLNPGSVLAQLLPTIDPALRRTLEALPDGDRVLAESFARLPVVLGAAIDMNGVAGADPGLLQAPPLAEIGGDPRPFLPRFPGLVRNLDLLTEASAGTGVVSLPLEPDGVLRRVPAAIEVGGAVLPTLALEMLRAAQDSPVLAIHTTGHGIDWVSVGTGAVPTDSQGRIWMHYAPSDSGRYISAARLMAGGVAPGRLRGKLVLIGSTAAGLMDLHATPLGILMPGIDIHAQLLDSLLSGGVLTRSPLATLGELAALVAFGLAVIFLQPRLSTRQLLVFCAAGFAALLAGSWIAYAAALTLVDGAFPAVAAAVVYAVLIAIGFVAARRRTEAALREREIRLRDLQAELLDVSRRSAVAQLSSALTHELNQPLAAIGNYVQACRRMLRGGGGRTPEKVYGYIDLAVAQVDRAAAIISGLRDIVEKGRTVRAPENANDVLEDAVASALLGPAAAAVTVRRRYAPALPPVLINRIQIQQVVLNLVRNAVEAMSGTNRRMLAIETRASDGDVEVAISDTGPGLSPEVEQRLFKPVVSTKDTGMGIGLTICRSIIEAHQGRLWATRNDDGGMTFHFTLRPAADGSAEAAK